MRFARAAAMVGVNSCSPPSPPFLMTTWCNVCVFGRTRSKRGDAHDGLDHRFYLKDSDHRITWNQHRLVDAGNAVHGPPEAPTADLLGPCQSAESPALIDLMDFGPVQPAPSLLGGSPGRGGGGAGPSLPPPTDLVARLQALGTW